MSLFFKLTKMWVWVGNGVKVGHSYASTMIQIYFKYVPSVLQVCFQYAPSMLQVASKYALSETMEIGGYRD